MRRILVAIVLAVLAAPVEAQQTKIRAQDLPNCSSGSPSELWILNSTDSQTCERTSIGRSEAHCCCANGVWSVCGENDLSPLFLYKPGLSGGQTAYGGSATDDDLTLFANSVDAAAGAYIEITGGDAISSTASVQTFLGDSLSITPDTGNGYFQSVDSGGATVVWRLNAAGEIRGTKFLSLGDPANLGLSVCIASKSDRMFHDTDCDDFQDPGEEYIDNAGGVSDHGLLSGLGDDDHTQYAILGGRGPGQTLDGSSSSSGTLSIGSDGTAPYARLSLNESFGAAAATFTLDGATLTANETEIYFFTGSVYPFSVDSTALGANGRLRLGSARSDASSTCIGRSGSDYLWHDTDCDGIHDTGEDRLDDDLPDANDITEAMLKAVDSAVDEEYLTYESTTGDFEWEPGNELDSYTCFPGAMVRVSGTGSEGVAGKAPFVTLLDAETGEWSCYVNLSQEDQGKTFDLFLMLAPSSSVSCNYYVTARWKAISDATNISVTYGSDTAAVASSGTAAVSDFYDTGTNWTIPGGTNQAFLSVDRQGSHASDTCSNTLYVLGIYLVEQAN